MTATPTHPNNRRRFLGQSAGTLAAMLAAPTILNDSTVFGRAPVAAKKLLFFTKSAGFEHDVVKRNGAEYSYAERIMMELGKKHGIEVVCSKDGRIFDKDYESFDGYLFYTTLDLTKEGTDKQPAMSAKGKQNLIDAVANGKGFAGSHCASDTFHTPGEAFAVQETPDPYIQMIGGEFIRHGRQQVAEMKVASPTFPGVPAESFSLNEEWYSLKNFAKDMHVVLVQETKGMVDDDYKRPAYPATWARRHGKGRVFYTSMGHREDVWTNPKFESILIGGLNWALGTVEADVPSNLSTVCPEASTLPVIKK